MVACGSGATNHPGDAVGLGEGGRMGRGTKGGGGGEGAGTVHSGPKHQTLVYDILSRGGGKWGGGRRAGDIA